MKTYTVSVRTATGEWTTHSTHSSYRDAVDQADLVHGRVDGEACNHGWAVAQQGCHLSYEEWLAQDDDERAEWEAGAAGIPTA